MAKVVKLFRSPQDADKALTLLKKSGIADSDVSVVLHQTEENKAFVKKIPGLGAKGASTNVGEVLSTGPVSAAVKDNLAAALSKELGISEEQSKYYEFVVGIGGIVVAVQTDDAKTPKVREILKQAETLAKPVINQTKSPGFAKASRMATTNPVDASMSGDFRRY